MAMDMDDLGKLIKDKHKETQDEISSLGEKVDSLVERQTIVETKLSENVTTKVDFLESQKKCQDQVYAAIRKASLWNKIGSAIATVAATLAGIALWAVGKKS